jgi:GxxExxY protein
MKISPDASKDGKDKEAVAAAVVDCAFRLHRDLGPGLLESVYEAVLARQLETLGLRVRRQEPVPIVYDGMRFEEGFRADLIVGEIVVVELKSVENLCAVHHKQLLTYLRLLNLPLGLLINFGAATFKEGVKRIVNGPQSFETSHLRVNQPFKI